MNGDQGRDTTLADVLAQDPRVPWFLAATFVVAGITALQANIFLNNEGILTWIFAGVMSESPRDMLFCLKLRPPISLLYAPIAAMGLTPFLWAHTLLAGLAIPLTASLARQFDHDAPNLAAALVAVSPLYLAGAASGVQNAEATIGVLLVAWLLARKRPVAAGLVLSVVVVARVETAVFALAFAAYAAVTPGHRRLLTAVFVIPTIFVLIGAVYHGDLLWPLHYPSSVPSNPASERLGEGGTLGDFVTTVLALTPVACVLLWTSFRQGRLETTVTLAAIAFVVAVRGVPFTQLVYVSDAPRYVLPALPFLALAASRAQAQWGRNWRDTIARGAVLLGVASLVVWLAGPAGAPLFAVAVACVASAALAFVSKPAAALALIATCAAGMFPLLPTTRLAVAGREARQLDEGTRWIAAKVPRGSIVVTDEHLLAIWLAKHEPGLNIDVRHVVTADMLYEARRLTNPSTKQFEKLFGTTRFFYAPWIFPAQIASLPGDVFFVLKGDPHPRRRDLSEPPFDRIEWLINAEDWMGGRLSHDAATSPPGAR